MKNLILIFILLVIFTSCEKRTIFLPTQVRVVNQKGDSVMFHTGGSVFEILPYDTLQFPMYKNLGKNLVGQDCIFSYEGLPYEVELYGPHLPGEGIVQTGVVTPNIWINY